MQTLASPAAGASTSRAARGGGSLLLGQVAEWIFLLIIAVLPLDLYIMLPGGSSGIFLSEVLAAEGCLLLALAIAAAWLFRRTAGIKLDPRALMPLGLFLAVGLVSSVGAHSRAEALRGCAQFAFFVGLYALAWVFAPRSAIRTRALVCIVVSFSLVVGFGLLDTISGIPDVAGYVLNVQRDPATLAGIERAASTFRFPDELNAYLVFILPLLTACAIKVRSQVDRIAYITLIGLGFWLLLLTYARSALLICVLIGPLLMFMLGGKRLGFAAVAVALLLMGLLVLQGGTVSTRLLTLLSTSDTGYTSRLETWNWALNTFVHHPLLGVGPRNLRFQPGAPLANAYTGLLEDNGESSYINFLADMGIVGGIALLVCIVGAMRRLLTAIRAGLGAFEQAWHVGVFVGLCALLLDSLVHSTFGSTQVTGLLCVLVGLSGPGIKSERAATSARAPLRAAEKTPIATQDIRGGSSPAIPTWAGEGERVHVRPLGSRIVFLVNSGRMGGVEKHSLNLASELRRQGADVLVVCPPHAGLIRELSAREIPYRELALGMNMGRVRGYLGTLAFLNPFSRHRSDRWVLRLAREMPSIFVCVFPREQLLCAQLSKRHGLRTVWIMHSPLHFTLHRLLIRPLMLRCARLTDAIVFVSRTRAEEAIVAGFPAGRLAVIPAAVENSLLAYPSGTPARGAADDDLLAVVSRLVKPKGVQYAIAAMPRILQQRPAARLVIAGSGRYERHLKRMVHRLGLDDRVQFLGYVAHPETVLREASLLIFPSVDEGEAMPAVILEAYACGVPVVATPVGGVREIVLDESTGLLVWPGDPSALAAAVIDLLGDPARSHEMGTTARALVEAGFTFEQAGTRFLQVLQVVETKGADQRDPDASSAKVRAVHGSRLLGSTALLAASKVMTALVTAMWTILAARVLVPAEYGNLMLAAGIAELGAILTDAGFTAVATRELAQARQRDVAAITGTLIYLKLGLGIVAALVALALGLLLPFGSDVRKLMFVFAPSLMFISLNSLTLVFRARLVVRFVAAISFAMALVGTYVTVLVYWISPQALSFAEARLAITVAGGVFALALVLIRYRPRLIPNARIALRLSAGAIPLGVALALNILFVRIDVPIIALLTNSTQVAIYTSAYRILDMVTLFPVSAAAIALPLMASMRARNRRHLGSFVRLYLELAVVFGVLSALVLTFISRPLLALLYAGRYDSAETTLVVLAWAGAAAFVTNVFAPLAVALDHQRALVLAAALGLLANVGLNLLLIPYLGTVGAAYATLATEIVVTIPLAVVAIRTLRIQLISRPMIGAGLATISALIALPLLSIYFTMPLVAQALALVVWVAVLVAAAPRWVGSLFAALRRHQTDLDDSVISSMTGLQRRVRPTGSPVASGAATDLGGDA